MLSKLAAIALAAAVWPPSSPGGVREAKAAAARIPSVAGGSVLDRMARCGLRVSRGSYIEPIIMDLPDQGLRAGDQQLSIFFDAPPLAPGEHANRDLLARWRVRKNVAHPMTGWAMSIQNRPAPLGSAAWLDC